MGINKTKNHSVGAATENFIKEYEELLKDYMKMINFEDLKDVDPSIFGIIQKSFKILNSCKELALVQAQAMDDMNAKLDTLIEQTKK